MRLVSKYTSVTSTVLLATMVVFAFLGMQALERFCLQEAVKDIDNLSETILSTTHHQMLMDDRQRVYQAIQEVSFQKGIVHIRLINKDGRISFSTDPREVGNQVDKQAEACNMCHAVEEAAPLLQASSMSRSRRFRDEEGQEVLGMARGIYNQPNCSAGACHVHSLDTRLLGVLDVTMSLEEMEQNLASFGTNMAFFTLGLLVVLTLSLYLVTQRFIHRPVQKLLNHTRRLTEGEFTTRIEEVEQDELGDLEMAFNQMARSLGKVQGELRELASSLEVKVEERTREVQQIQARLMRSEKLASLGELVAGIAHEINNPLTGILVFSSMVLDSPRLDDSLRRDVETVHRETRRCAAIVRRLLEFSREAIPLKGSADINEILEKTLELFEHQACFHDIRLLRGYRYDLPRLQVDANQLKQVFMNILLNAAQAMPGGGELTLATELDPAGRQVLVRISDTGCGIPEENRERIFDPFFTTKEEGGTGLGLSVSYGIIQNHGGRIEVESTEGEGTTFLIVLPLEGEEGAGEEEKAGQGPGSPVAEAAW